MPDADDDRAICLQFLSYGLAVQYLVGEVKDALHRRSAVNGSVVLGEEGDDLLVWVEPAANGLQIRLIILVQSHAAG